jgi:hypothetical protein
VGHYWWRMEYSMPRIEIPIIPDDIINKLTTIESTLAWMQKLEKAQERLEEALDDIKGVLKYVIRPTFNKLNNEAYEEYSSKKEEKL